MQAGRRLIQNIKRVASAAAAQFLRKLDALRLAAGKRGGLLPQMNVIEADIVQRLELVAERRHVLQHIEGFRDRHVKHFRDIFPFVADFQRFAVIAAAVALFAGDVHVRQKVHFDFNHAVAFAGFAAPALDVKAEPPRLITAQPGFRQAREQVAQRREQAGICRRIRARRPANRTLINVNNLINVFDAENVFMRPGRLFGSVKMAR